VASPTQPICVRVRVDLPGEVLSRGMRRLPLAAEIYSWPGSIRPDSYANTTACTRSRRPSLASA
jgi:hypothetical protein